MIEAGSGPVLVVAPHPDDETLGAGGLMLRARAAGRPVHWLIVTEMPAEDGWPAEKIARREQEIKAVAEAFGIAQTHRLGLPTARLDTLPLRDVVGAMGAVVRDVAPEILLLPHRGDAHSDHAVVHDAGTACGKWFRFPSVRWTLAYETLSETDAGMNQSEAFWPSLFVDIGDYLDEKLRIAALYGDEIQAFPFPRSEVAMRAHAALRGAACGATAAETFMLLRARI